MDYEFKDYEVGKQIVEGAEEILKLKAKLDIITNALDNFVYKETATTHLEVVSKGLANEGRGLFSTDAEDLVFVLAEVLNFCGVPEMVQYISRIGTGASVNNINPQELSLRCFVSLRGGGSPKEKIFIHSPNVRYALSRCIDSGLSREESFFVLVTMVLNSFYDLSKYLGQMHPLFPLLGPLLAVTTSHYDRVLFYPFSLKQEQYLLKKTITPLRTKTLASSLLLASLESMVQERVEKLQKAFLTPCVVDLEEYAKLLQEQTARSSYQGRLLVCVKGVPLNRDLRQHHSIKDKLKLRGEDYLLEEESYTASQNMDTVYFAGTWGAPLGHSLVLKNTKVYCRQVLDAVSFDVINTSHKNLAFINNLESMSLSNGKKLLPFIGELGLKDLSVRNMHDLSLLNFRHED